MKLTATLAQAAVVSRDGMIECVIFLGKRYQNINTISFQLFHLFILTF